MYLFRQVWRILLSRNSPIKIESVGKLNTDKLQAITSAHSEPALHYAEQERSATTKQGMARLKATSALAASALLAGSLLLGACGDESDCIISTPPATAAAAGGSTFSSPAFGTPAASYVTPGTPSSSEFTSGQTTTANRTYCQSRRTGGYYWYSGVYVGGSSSNGGFFGSGSSGSSGSSSS